MASVPLAVVLVLAVVVPVAVTPGTFGYSSWPSDRGEAVSESTVPATPKRIRQREPGAATAEPAEKAVATKRPAAERGDAGPTTDGGPRRPATPAPEPHADGPGRQAPDSPATPDEPASPSLPASEPEPPAPAEPEQPAPDLIADTGEPPVLRDDPTVAPDVPPPPAPVTAVVPEPVASLLTPDDECGDDEDGDKHRGHGNGHGNGHGRGNGHAYGHRHR